MKITNISIGIGSVGLFVICVSVIQWFFRFPDVSQLVLGCGIGIIFIGFAYIHSWMRNIGEELEDIHKGIDGLRVWAVNELEKNK